MFSGIAEVIGFITMGGIGLSVLLVKKGINMERREYLWLGHKFEFSASKKKPFQFGITKVEKR